MGAIGSFVSIGFLSVGVYYALRSTDVLFDFMDSRRSAAMADKQLTLQAEKAKRQWLASRQTPEERTDLGS
ncbi:hypothetical protein WJX84_012161 [Apatococcus fuscideae]|uniref:Uncharacterized protein n=1 Tax=Apatococcus fuscideae TaxID=2026836 RepID=A0AAW1TD23_9CHLO